MCPNNSYDPRMHGAPQIKSTAINLGIAWLAIAAGSLDVISFLTLDHVFASAMTGNTALLGIAVSDGDWNSASKPAIALVGFVIGTASASVASDSNFAKTRQLAALRGLLLLESVCLAGFALARQPSSNATPEISHFLLILICSFSMGMQVIAANMVGARGVNTIVFTSTVAAAVSSVTGILLGRQEGPQVRPDTLRQLLSFAAYAAGALIAGLLAWSKFALQAWVPVTAVLLALVCFREFGNRAGNQLAGSPD